MNINKAVKILRQNLSREPLLAFNSILILTLTFITLNGFVFLVAGSSVILKYLEDRAQVTIFFSDSVDESYILEKKSEIESHSMVSSVSYVSKDKALEIFKELSKDEPALLESLQSNPLPASLEIKAKKIADLKSMSEEFSKIEGAEDVKYYEDVVDTFRRWSTAFRVAALTLLVVLSLISVIMVLMTIGLTIHSKGIEVEILKLVGASDKYVKAPLILQGIFYGVFAAVLSVVFMAVTLPVLAPVVLSFFGQIELSASSGWMLFYFWQLIFETGASIMSKASLILILLVLEVGWGVILGYLGASMAIRKYLRY